jgi:hypothetical protein
VTTKMSFITSITDSYLSVLGSYLDSLPEKQKGCV